MGRAARARDSQLKARGGWTELLGGPVAALGRKHLLRLTEAEVQGTQQTSLLQRTEMAQGRKIVYPPVRDGQPAGHLIRPCHTRGRITLGFGNGHGQGQVLHGLGLGRATGLEGKAGESRAQNSHCEQKPSAARMERTKDDQLEPLSPPPPGRPAGPSAQAPPGRPAAREEFLRCTSLSGGLLRGSLTLMDSFLPPGAERLIVEIGSQTFMRFEDVQTWSSARRYCRQHHTDLANLQAVANGEDLKPITSKTEAWIGLYYNADSSSTSWAGSQNDSVPPWLEVPMLSGGQCAGLRAFFSYTPRVSAMNCSSPQPFICFYDTSTGPQASSPEVAMGTTSRTSPGLSTSLTSAAPGPASTTRLQLPGSPGPTELCLGAPHLCSSAPQPQGATPSDSPADSASPGSTSSVPEGVSRTPPTTAQGTPLHLTDPDGTPVPGGGVTRWPSAASPSLGSTDQASATSGTVAPSGSSASSWSHGTETPGGSPGQEESVAVSPRSGKPAVAQRTTAPPASTAQSQAAARESNATAVVSTDDGTEVRPTTAGTRAQRLATSAWTRTETGERAGHAFGILKADFVLSSLKNPEEMRDQLLSEIQAVLQRALGHEQFSLKWVGAEANGR